MTSPTATSAPPERLRVQRVVEQIDDQDEDADGEQRDEVGPPEAAALSQRALVVAIAEPVRAQRPGRRLVADPATIIHAPPPTSKRPPVSLPGARCGASWRRTR